MPENEKENEEVEKTEPESTTKEEEPGSSDAAENEEPVSLHCNIVITACLLLLQNGWVYS